MKEQKTIRIDQDILKSLFPSQHWSPQGSGIQIREEVAPKLKKLWDNLKSSERQISK